MNPQEIVNLRLYNQLVSHQPYQKPEEVVRWMGAMQAQDYSASLFAIQVRVPPSSQVRETTVEQAIASRRIVRTWPMRGTLHWVDALDVRWMLSLLTPRVIRSCAGRYKQLALDEVVFSRSRKIIEQALQGGNQLSRPELFGLLEQEGISTSNQRGIHILSHLAQQAVICFGPKKGKQPTFVLLEEWIPQGNSLEKEEALAVLAWRYFSSHGPATVHDFSTWSGLMVSEARKGLELIAHDFEKLNLDGKTYFFSAPKKEPGIFKNSEEAWLLPAFDEMLCGYKDKSAVLPLADVKSTILRNGIIRPILVVKNQTVGTWKRIVKKDAVILETVLFQPVAKKYKKRIKERSKNLGMVYFFK